MQIKEKHYTVYVVTDTKQKMMLGNRWRTKQEVRSCHTYNRKFSNPKHNINEVVDR